MTDAERIKELERENTELRRRLADALGQRDELARKLEECTRELEEWRRGHRERRRRRSSRPEGKRGGAGRGPGRPAGAKGSNRPVPERIDETVDYPLPPTCTCGGPVEDTGKEQSTIVQELPRIEVRNVKHVAHVGRCTRCGARCVQRLPGTTVEGEPGAQVQLGPGIQALSIDLHFERHVPLLGVVRLLDRWFGVQVSAPGLSQLFDRLRVRTAPARAEILVKLRQSTVVGFDETSHRQDGEGAWLWLGRTSELSYFHVDRSRSGEVFDQLLGEEFIGVVVSDFYGAYTRRTDLVHAYCNAHTVRELKKIAEVRPGPLTIEFRDCFSDILAAGKRAQEADDPCARTNVRRRMQRLIDTERFGADADLLRLQGRLEHHFDDVLRYVDRADVPMTNNDSERDIRPAAVHRKISGGTRSANGSETYAHWMSVTQTLHKNDGNLRTWVEESFQAHLARLPPPSALSPPSS
jgi:transposase